MAIKDFTVVYQLLVQVVSQHMVKTILCLLYNELQVHLKRVYFFSSMNL